MSGPIGPGKSLLDRLSALKGGSSSISLDRSSNALNVALTGVEPAKPPSREDALAARLRSLRNTPEREEPQATAQQSQTPKVPGQQTDRGATASVSPSAIPSYGSHPAAVAAPQSHTAPFNPHPPGLTMDDVDPLLQTEDETLEDLLSGEDFDPLAREWTYDSMTNSNSCRVNALLKEISKASPTPHTPDEGPTDQTSNRLRDLDDSEGEEMSRGVDALLSQAVDEARLSLQSEQAPDHPPALPGNSKYGGTAGTNLRRRQKDEPRDTEPRFSLPSVPSDRAPPNASGDGGGGLPDLSLPSVPSGGLRYDVDSDFDNDIATRMAALSGLGGPLQGGMGLPSVPTFQPADRAVKRLISKTGYTDEDVMTWCTVCLEDATLQCLGCEDVYCARCWHEMHVGPDAAFDDRIHKPVQFVKPKNDQKRRVALGAS